MYKYITTGKNDPQDRPYTNGEFGMRGWLTKLTAKQLNAKNIFWYVHIPKWVRKELGL